VTVIQLHHGHDDPIADHDSLTEFARQDQHGGSFPGGFALSEYGSPSRGLGTILTNECGKCKYLDFSMQQVTWLRTCPRCMPWMAPTARSIGDQAAHRRIARGVIARAIPRHYDGTPENSISR
jgi:hypothetical protein